MSDVKEDIKNLLKPSFGLIYSEDTADSAVSLFASSARDQRLYIIGCLLLTLTASVVPQFTLLEDRSRSLMMCGPPHRRLDDTAAAHSLAEAGFFYRRGGGNSSDDRDCGSGDLVCFHCCVRLPRGGTAASGGEDPLQSHRSISPNCYFARLLELVRCHCRGGITSADAVSDRLGVPGDARRYEKALRKLRTDLAGGGIDFAAGFGFEAKSLAVWATRHFMRHNGACPSRAGDLVELAHESEGLFSQQLLDKVDVRKLLELLALQRRT